MLSFPFLSRHLRLALPLRPLHHSRSLPARCSLSCRRYRCCAAVQVVGIALDDLQWATVTQFRFHYNASHPLVISNMRRVLNSTSSSSSAPTARSGSSSSSSSSSSASRSTGGGGGGSEGTLIGPVTEKEFHKKLPRYPNDGVLLIDVQVCSPPPPPPTPCLSASTSPHHSHNTISSNTPPSRPPPLCMCVCAVRSGTTRNGYCRASTPSRGPTPRGSTW